MFYVISVPNAVKITSPNPVPLPLAETRITFPGPRVIPALRTTESFASTGVLNEIDPVSAADEATKILNSLSALPVLEITILETTLDVAGLNPGAYKLVSVIPGAT
jgi:hypothetical protein